MAMIFDIETEPLPLEELQKVCEPFNEEDVKVGNIKDPEKIRAKIDQCRENHWKDIQERAALNATTAKVVAIGYRDHGEETPYCDMFTSERDNIVACWNRILQCMKKGIDIVGFHSNRFDIPFLVRRSWLIGCGIPDIFSASGYLKPCFIDLHERWQCGDRQATIKLNSLAKYFGIDGKYQGLDGSMFFQLLKVDPATAKEYLLQDIRMTAHVAERMLGQS